MNQYQTRQTDFFRFMLQAVVRRRKIAVIVFSIVFAASFLYAMFATKYYASSATLMAQADRSLTRLGVIPDGIDGSSMPGASLLGMGGSLEYKLLNILRSRDLFETVVADAELLPFIYPEKWDPQARCWKDGFAPNMDRVFEEKYQGEIFNAYFDEEMSSVKLKVVTPDPEMSARVARTVLANLQESLSEKVNTTAGRTREFLDRRLKEVHADMKEAEDTLKRFQVANKVYLPDSQISGTLGLISTLEAEKLSSEIEMGILSRYTHQNNPKIRALQDAIDEINQKIDQIRTGEQSPEKEAARMSMTLEKAPELLQQYLEHKRQVMVLERLYTLLTTEHEIAKIKEAKEDLSFIVIDAPRVATKKVKPWRSMIVIAGLVLAVLCGLAASLAREYAPQVRRYLTETVDAAQEPTPDLRPEPESGLFQDAPQTPSPSADGEAEQTYLPQ